MNSLTKRFLCYSVYAIWLVTCDSAVTAQVQTPTENQSLGTVARKLRAETQFLRMLKLMEGQLGLNDFALTDPLSKLASLYHVENRPADEGRMQERLQAIQANGKK